MSAIAGIYFLHGRPVNNVDLERMVTTLAHRGPDGKGVWIEGCVGLAHGMLWTTPESLHEKLPLANQRGDLVITADARIDNRAELIAALNLNDCATGSITDSRLILSAYEKWGEQCTDKLLGDFAFAIWDGRQHNLFCARDHFGVKPFYYYYLSERIFAFASEIKALLCLKEVPRQLNELRVADYLVSMFDDTSITFYQDILRLPPSRSMRVSQNGIKVNSYWSLDPSRELHLGPDEEYAEAFLELFTDAVSCRLRSAFPLGSLLSGGLDSSSITCIARQLLASEKGQKLLTFSAIFDQVTECDERRFINAIVTQNGLEPHYVYGDELGPLSDLDRVLWHQDEAFYSPNLFLNWGLYITAKEKGVRVLLDGFDGDTTVSHGVGYLNELANEGRWFTLGREIRGYARNFNLSSRKLFWSYIRRYGLDPVISKSRSIKLATRIFSALRRRVPHRSNESDNLPAWGATLNPEFVHLIGLAERRRSLLNGRTGAPKTERENHYRILTWGVMPFTLEVLDRAAAAFAIEPRFPFWDKRLAEFCLALPPEQKMHKGMTRMVLRRALEGVLPAEVQWRGGKSNLGPNFDHGLLVNGRVRLDQVIMENPETIEKYVDITALREAYQRFVSRQMRTDDALEIWKAVSLALWLQGASLTEESFQKRR